MSITAARSGETMKAWAIGTLCFLFATSAAAVATFDTGVEGFTQGQFAPGSVVSVPDQGPDGAGDFALRVTAAGPGIRLHVFTRSNQEFLGDYLGDGVTALRFDAMAPLTNTQSVSLFGVFFRDTVPLANFGDRWVSVESAVVPANGEWATYTLDLSAEGQFVHPNGANLFSDDFAAIEHFGLRHQNAANQPGGSILPVGTQIYLDNVELLPEPAAATGALAAWLALAALRRVSKAITETSA